MLSYYGVLSLKGEPVGGLQTHCPPFPGTVAIARRLQLRLEPIRDLMGLRGAQEIDPRGLGLRWHAMQNLAYEDPGLDDVLAMQSVAIAILEPQGSGMAGVVKDDTMMLFEELRFAILRGF